MIFLVFTTRKQAIFLLLFSLHVFCNAATLTGSMHGEFSVDSHGNANYNMKISVPPSSGGFAPKLAFTYNSGQKMSKLGFGWSLTGMQSIIRCGQSRVIEGEAFTPGVNLDYNDRYCLSGQRLLSDGIYGADGTQYVTELDNWARIRSVGTCGNGPCGFYATDAQGTQYTFGGADEATARPFKLLGRNELLRFPLTYAEDRNGNIISYEYQTFSPGEVVLSSIHYRHGSASHVYQREVRMSYQARPDVSEHYFFGQLYKSTQRLAGIATFAAGQLITRYEISYDTSPATQRSRVTSVQRCGLDDCLPATRFNYPAYREAGLALNSISNNSIGGWTNVGFKWQRRYLTFDYNLDGRTDMIEIYRTGDNRTGVSVWLQSDAGYIAGANSEIGGWTDMGSSNPRRYLTMDHDRDGRTDIIEIYQDNSDTKATVWRNTGDGFASLTISGVGSWSNVNSTYAKRYLAFDASNDGYTDIIEIFQNGSRTNTTIWHNNNGHGFISKPETNVKDLGGWSNVGEAEERRYLSVDANGDGLTDILEIYHSGSNTGVTRWLSNGHGFHAGGSSDLGFWVDRYNENGLQFFPMDVNGDGLADLVKLYKHSANETGGMIYWNTGTGFVQNETYSPLGNWKSLSGSENLQNRYMPMDVNADGKTDLVKLFHNGDNTTRAELFYATNAGFVQGGNYYIGGWSDTNNIEARRYYPVDANGDGLPEIVEVYRQSGEFYIPTAGETGANTWQFNRPADQDQIVAITDGLGEQTLIRYSTLANPDVYIRDKDITGEENDDRWRNATAAVSVVQQYQTKRSASADCRELDAINDTLSDTPDTGCYQFGYRYEEAIIDLDRGFQGFKRVILSDEQHNTETTMTHSVKFPQTGLLLSKTTRAADTQALMGQETHIYHQCQSGGDDPHNHCLQAPSGVYRVFLDYKHQAHYTVGTHNYTLTHRFGYYQPHLSNGQPITVTYDGDKNSTKGDGAFTTCRQFASGSDGQHWKRSFVTHLKQTAWLPGNCFSANSPWDIANDLSWHRISYDINMNTVLKEVYLDQTSTADTGGHWLTTQYSYNSFGNPIHELKPTGLETEFTYDASQTFVTSEKSSGAGLTLTSRYEYDLGSGQRIRSTNPQGFKKHSLLDEFGRVIETRESDPDDADALITISTATYQASSQPGRIERVTRHRKSWSSNNPSTWPAVTEVVDYRGTAFETYHPADGDQQLISGDKTYNHKGQVRNAYVNYLGNSLDDRGEYNSYHYDRHGRLSSIVSSFNGRTTEYEYLLHDNRNVRKSVPSPEGGGQAIYETRHNTRGKVVWQQGPSGGITRYRFDALNRVTEIIDPLGQIRTLTYNSLGQKLSDTSAERGTTQYEYDDYGRLSKQKDAAGRVLTQSYDQLGRLLTQATTHSGYSTRIDNLYRNNSTLGIAMLGRLERTDVTVNGERSASNTYRYNARGLLIEHRYTLDIDASGSLEADETQVFSLDYDAQNALAALTYPDGSRIDFERAQDKNHLLTGILYQYADDGVLQQKHLARFEDFHASGKAKTTTYGNGVIQQQGFDALGRLTSTELSKGTTSYLSRSYDWNQANKIDQIDDRNQPLLSQTFNYDASGHLIRATGAYGALAMGYDLAGNRTSLNDDAYNYAATKAHQLQEISAADGSKTTYRYDDSGYLTTKVNGSDQLNYHWDGHGNLVRVTRGSGTTVQLVTDFVYNERNNRIRKRDYNDGVLVRSTHYLPGLYEVVVNESTQAKSYTNYLGGIAAKTEVVSSSGVAYNSIEERIRLHTGLSYASVMPTSLAQLDEWFTGIGLILAHNNLGARIIAAFLWFSVVGGLILFIAWQWLRNASKDSSLGQLRRRLLVRLVAAGWLSRRRAHRLDTPSEWHESLSLSRYCLIGLMCLCTLGNILTPAYATLWPGANGAGVPVAGQMRYFHGDQVASTSLVSDDRGMVVTQIEYTPFGKIVDSHSSGTDDSRTKFAGKELDQHTGLSYFGHRYYDVEIGRFISPDPAAQYHSPYLYGADDPLTMIDPNGEIAIATVMAVAAVIVAIAGSYVSASMATGEWNPGKWGGTGWGVLAGSLGISLVLGGLVPGFVVSVLGEYVSSEMASVAVSALFGGIDGAANSGFIAAMTGGDVGRAILLGAALGLAVGLLVGVAGTGFKGSKYEATEFGRSTRVHPLENHSPNSDDEETLETLYKGLAAPSRGLDADHEVVREYNLAKDHGSLLGQSSTWTRSEMVARRDAISLPSSRGLLLRAKVAGSRITNANTGVLIVDRVTVQGPVANIENEVVLHIDLTTQRLIQAYNALITQAVVYPIIDAMD